MAWEWITPVTSAAVGVAAIIGSGWTSANTRRNDRELAAERHEHERLVAHEGWIRERRADTYLALLDLAEEIGHYVQRLHPLMGRTWAQGEPELPGYEVQRHARARIAAFGSKEIRALHWDWHETVQKAISTADEVHERVPGARQRMSDLRAEEREKRNALGDRIAEELQRSDGPPSASADVVDQSGRSWHFISRLRRR